MQSISQSLTPTFGTIRKGSERASRFAACKRSVPALPLSEKRQTHDLSTSTANRDGLPTLAIAPTRVDPAPPSRPVTRFHKILGLLEEHFLHSEPEYYLAAFLYSFLPNRTPSMGLPTSIEFLMQSATLRRSGPTVVRKANDSGQRQQGIIRCKIVQRTRRRNAISAGTFVDDFLYQSAQRQ